MTRTEFLRQQTLSGANKCRRTPIPPMSTADLSCSLAERKALALKWILENMPVYIGPQELIVGTRTFFTPAPGNEDGHDPYAYRLSTPIPYINPEDIQLFGCDQSYLNRTHFTPDFGIILEKGIDGILSQAATPRPDLPQHRQDFLRAVTIAYTGLQQLILRYAQEAKRLSETASAENRAELLEISQICQKISSAPPDTFHEAVQLLWFAHLGTIVESFGYISYGRLDVLLGKFLKDTPRETAGQLIQCLLLKMYDQTDVATSYLGVYAAQLIVTLGGVLPDGTDAVNEVTMLFLEAAALIRLPDPEFNLRINSKNTPAFLEKAAKMTVSGCNFLSYFNDDLFVESLHRAGIPLEYARDYGFDLCQDINIPGKGDVWRIGIISLADLLIQVLRDNQQFTQFSQLLCALKKRIADTLRQKMADFNAVQENLSFYAAGDLQTYFDGIHLRGLPPDRNDNSPMAPLPLLSGLFHGCLETGLDVAFEPYPVKEKGLFFRTATECINSLAAIQKTVFDEKCFTLQQIWQACESNFTGPDGAMIQKVLWNCPKWGNDDDYVDSIGKDLLEFSLRECQQYQTFLGGQVLGGIHQPHPVAHGAKLMATPEGRSAYTPIAVTLSPENGTMRNGPTAALLSAAKLDPMLIQWNFCVMVNYFASVFRGNNGAETFLTLLDGYFRSGGLQHQPNVLDVEELKKAQQSPENYKDLIVRLWGVSAHFVDLAKELQDEIIARFT